MVRHRRDRRMRAKTARMKNELHRTRLRGRHRWGEAGTQRRRIWASTPPGCSAANGNGSDILRGGRMARSPAPLRQQARMPLVRLLPWPLDPTATRRGRGRLSSAASAQAQRPDPWLPGLRPVSPRRHLRRLPPLSLQLRLRLQVRPATTGLRFPISKIRSSSVSREGAMNAKRSPQRAQEAQALNHRTH